MIKARFGDTGLLIGLSAGNLAKLQKGQPIMFDMSAVGLPTGRCIILFGATEEAIVRARHGARVGAGLHGRQQKKEAVRTSRTYNGSPF